MEIISLLLKINQQYYEIICQLLMLLCRFVPLRQWAFDELHSPKYQKFKTDKLPIIKTFEKHDYLFLLEYYLWKYGKSVSPIRRKSDSVNLVPDKTVCPRCGATHAYIYCNNGGKGQLRCKVCDFKFQKGDYHSRSLVLTCPYCRHALSPKKDRKHFIVHKCVNDRCSFYEHNISKLPLELPFDERYKYKLRYIYREFTMDFFAMDLHELPDYITSFKFRKNSSHIMGLCLSYHVNLGLSLRKTSQALLELHGIRISHQMVANYAKTAALLIKPFIDTFDYNPSNKLAADETYVKIKGETGYLWIIMDTISRSVLGYFLSASRDVGACITAMRLAFDKFKSFPDSALTFVADGYSAYPLAAQQFKLRKGFDFVITQVIGLMNSDAVSTEFRPYKQKIERLNRTFKETYRVTCGYASDDGALLGVNLWVCYYNFLRPHETNNFKPLNTPDFLKKAPNMPDKWQLLIYHSQQIIAKSQLSTPS